MLLVLGIVAASALFNVYAYRGAARHRRRHPPACAADGEDRTPWPGRAWAFAVECTATALLGLATPLALRRRRVRPLDPDDPRPPVVLLHGYAQHAANFLWLARRLERDGWRHLARLAADDPVPQLADCISIYSADDAVVVPPSRAYYPGAFNVEVRGLGHMSLLFSRRVYTLVRENLAAERAPAAATAEGGAPWSR